MSELETFRQQTRAWLEENCPSSLRNMTTTAVEDYMCWGGKNWTFSSPDEKLWLDRMVDKGWTVPGWPTQYGGAGLSREETEILEQEMQSLNCPTPLTGFGIWMLGPALLQFGNEELKQQHLPAIARGEVRWCQGYSEPGAGSDLADVRTKAEDKGDHYLVNGQKVWTSYGDKADAIFVLVRSNPDARKHLGISFVLADMNQPGIEVRPITLISGTRDFCEVFFDDARVEKDQVVGEVNKGWDVAKYLLTHEREMQAGFGSQGDSQTLSDFALHIFGDKENLAASGMRDKIAEFEIDALAFDSTMNRFLSMAEAGESLGANSSMLKYYGTELNKRRAELMVDITGLDAANWDSTGPDGKSLPQTYLRTKGNSIEGGTTEVQLNIMSKFLLGLPSGK
ncbi:acyl-CoA dehydrogenase family protein [Maricurvus nonylphenolicus]|uniref:acyl-CoA dehydrogenase family protein n=1 Tax=Maricurvus nonylphenolicus TaxID=1008307 RepID=UPI0036F3D4F5